MTREPEDIFPTLNYMLRHIFPFNYVIPGQSTNTLFHFRSYCEDHPHLAQLFTQLQTEAGLEDALTRLDNRFSAQQLLGRALRRGHAAARARRRCSKRAPPQASTLGPVIFVLTEFQILDRHTEQRNELGDASHSSYKERQKRAVALRLKVGTNSENTSPPSQGIAGKKQPKD